MVNWHTTQTHRESPQATTIEGHDSLVACASDTVATAGWPKKTLGRLFWKVSLVFTFSVLPGVPDAEDVASQAK